MSRRSISVLMVAGLLCGACGKDRRPAPDMALTAALGEQSPPFVSRDGEGAKRWKLTRQFYQSHGNAPVWIRDRKPLPRMDELINALLATLKSERENA